MKYSYIISSVCACVLASATAHAGVAFFSNSSGNGYISTVAALAPLNGTNTLVKLSTPKGGKYIITYSAECGATQALAPLAGMPLKFW